MTDKGRAATALLSLLAQTALAVESMALGQSRQPSSDARALHHAVLAVELRLQLQDQVLLGPFQQIGIDGLAAVQSQFDTLRRLLADARIADRPLASRRLLWSGIAKCSALHFEAVARLTLAALESPDFDAGKALSRARSLRERWRDELARTEDIEDEEADPVGQPPR